MTREECLTLLKQNLKNQNLIKHSLSVEAAMCAFAKYFGEDEADWAIAGLLHDIDYSLVMPDKLGEHSRLGAQICRENGLSEKICAAILTHNDAHNIEPATRMGKTLRSIDPLTGLIVAATLVLPSKKISDVNVETVINRMDEKSFAKGANREIIRQGAKLMQMPLAEIIRITLMSIQGIAEEIGL